MMNRKSSPAEQSAVELLVITTGERSVSGPVATHRGDTQSREKERDWETTSAAWATAG